MKKYKLLILAITLGLTLILSACVPGPRVTGTPGISVSDEMAFVSYGNLVYSLDINSGAVEWSYPAEPSPQVVFYAPALVTESFVYVGDLANNFHKIDKETGAVIWTYSGAGGFFIGKATEEDGIVYAPANDGKLYALDKNGELLWTFETDRYIWAQPIIMDETIYVGSMDHFIYAISTDGEERWSVEMKGAIASAPAISEDGRTLFVSSLGKEMVALDTSNGASQWSFESNESIWGQSILIDENLFLADSAGNIHALDATNGEELWQEKVSSSVIGGLTVLDNGFVLATKEGLIKAYDFDGNSLWEATLDGETYQAPVTNGQVLIVGTIEGENLVYGFDIDGVQLWSTTPEN
jgi:outer membrane protein assembly factor BamB